MFTVGITVGYIIMALYAFLLFCLTVKFVMKAIPEKKKKVRYISKELQRAILVIYGQKE